MSLMLLCSLRRWFVYMFVNWDSIISLLGVSVALIYKWEAEIGHSSSQALRHLGSSLRFQRRMWESRWVARPVAESGLHFILDLDLRAEIRKKWTQQWGEWWQFFCLIALNWIQHHKSKNSVKVLMLLPWRNIKVVMAMLPLFRWREYCRREATLLSQFYYKKRENKYTFVFRQTGLCNISEVWEG